METSRLCAIRSEVRVACIAWCDAGGLIAVGAGVASDSRQGEGMFPAVFMVITVWGGEQCLEEIWDEESFWGGG